MHQDQAEEDSPNSSFWAAPKPEGQVKVGSSKSPFVPTINAITSSQELQWMVQPTILTSKSGACLPCHPYDVLDMSSRRTVSHTCLGIIRTAGSTHGQSRHHPLNQDEEKRRLRRERNKLAAAKCRNRRRELTDHLQGETEELEREQASLQTRVKQLQEERQRLELLLESHASVCTLACGADQPRPAATPHLLTAHPTEASQHHH